MERKVENKKFYINQRRLNNRSKKKKIIFKVNSSVVV